VADAASQTPKQILEEVLSPAMAKLYWTKNFQDAFPLSFDDFDIDAILPAMLYMFRRGFRRGVGYFAKTFGEESGTGQRTKATVRMVSSKLSARADVEGFEGMVGGNVMADLLLAFSMQNKTHAPGRDETLIRAFPSHYMSSWIDLPIAVANLRGVPEMLVALLAQQESGDVLDSKTKGRTRFPITHAYTENDLLRVFSAGMRVTNDPQNLNEQFDELAEIGVDQLLTVRIAHEMKEAPRRSQEGGRSGGGGIPNRQPLAEKAAVDFSEDLRIFLRAYGQAIPRQSFLPMLETAFCAGLSNVLLSTAEMLYVWREDGRLPGRREQHCTTLFVDCSDGGDHALRRASEQSTDECLRRLREIPAILSMLRILDHRADYRVKSKPLPPHMPSAAARIDLLGDLLHGRMKESERIDEELDEWAQQLGERLRDAGLNEDAVDMLGARQKPAAERLGTAIVMLMGEKSIWDTVHVIDSAWGIRIPHGLARSRRVHADQTATRKRTRVVRSIVFSDAFLDFAVHRHLFKTVDKQRPLPFVRFLAILRERYGFYVDQAPPGQSISGELLQRNRALLEARLRDLGLLVGVNDAESMKFLRPRFVARMA
jgi:hypothetical protein